MLAKLKILRPKSNFAIVLLRIYYYVIQDDYIFFVVSYIITFRYSDKQNFYLTIKNIKVPIVFCNHIKNSVIACSVTIKSFWLLKNL